MGEGKGVFASGIDVTTSLDRSTSLTGRFRGAGTAPMLSTIESWNTDETEALGIDFAELVPSNCPELCLPGRDGSALSLSAPWDGSELGTAFRVNESCLERNPGGDILFSCNGDNE